MSRIGKRPIPIPAQVIINLQGQQVGVKGPKGELSRVLNAEVSVTQEAGVVLINRRDDSRVARQRHGLNRTLVANMIEGVSQGFERRLEIQGVGYRAQVQGQKLILNVGYSKPVEVDPPQGVQIAVQGNTNVIVSGIDKEIVGNTAAKIRAIRPPEPYKGKGIRYAGELIKRKAGKAGKK